MELRGSIGKVRRKVGSKTSLFAKINGLIIILFIPVILFFTYSNGVSSNVIDKELKASNIKQLSFLSSQIESRVNQTMDFVVTFSKDPNVRKFNGLNIWDDLYDRMQTKYVIQEKMMLQSGVMNIWPVEFTVYSQQNKEAISNAKTMVSYDEAYLKRNVAGKWIYGDGEAPGPGTSEAFHWFYTDSFGQQDALRGSNLVVQASFYHENIQNMLDTYKSGGQGDPMFYHKGIAPILNRSANAEMASELTSLLDRQDLGDTMQKVVELDGKRYLISAVKSVSLGWHLVDIVPLDRILGPISFSRNLFYAAMAFLFVVGISASVLLYRNVQRPIRKLILGLQSVQRGDFSVRISSNVNNEFAFLFYRFNDMSKQIQSLIENVLNEKLRAREATLKQLQAQINPHFLYNCIGYMINMAQMKDEEAVVSMGHNLSAYYRYMTRLERPTASLQEETGLIVNYLDIQKLRNGRIHYRIDIPEEMLKQQVPRLMLQPVVENAVIHGVGKSYASGEIRMTGEMKDGFCKLCVDDDGPGMTEEQLDALNRQMKQPLREDMGYGFWNTNQRIIHLFGDKSGLSFGRSELGGLRAEMVWELPAAADVRRDSDTREGGQTHANDHR
ncbi:histidine kinase [Paenibacillus sp. LHD-117]|uniref:sensor histidine kinase n=1 Tax=Paenibacillus sp. LHD-117 TaxID=3071412 RepID=UPI0027E07850|nr:histidine kinase [Paenibacillus sp. LHD-117]MDQ6422380.1 histidine kinase [Paenibacillus sp. LHD-117]